MIVLKVMAIWFAVSILATAVLTIFFTRVNMRIGIMKAAREWGVDPSRVVPYKCATVGCSATHYTLQSVLDS